MSPWIEAAVKETEQRIAMSKITMDKKYQTRDGRAVRILCVDGPGNLCVYGIVTKANSDFINPMRWEKDGRFSWSGYCPENDLIPVPTKHEGWITVSHEYLAGIELTPRKVVEDRMEHYNETLHCVLVHVTWEE